ncbi:MFS transporter [Lentzea sp. NBRC 105346]|uniref:MFS transporter n=1 Tax=Lentzea sp. NBRC 105346 TaxID=3032205 RepID=UPI00249FD010|nr:MFS transporter [Lentzea sp. NBRC 105346]GLZ36283.1 MFS transporter [Lentzea sp. NBRC 105346]
MSTTALPVEVVQPESKIRGRAAVALAVVVSFWALILVDEMVVNISLAQIGSSLELSQTELSWVVNAYLLPYGGLLLLGGRLGDILGKRRMFVIGMALYTVGCLARALAPDAWLLIAARGVQGTGAALATPCVLALIMNLFAEGPLRRKAIGVYTIAGGAGAAVGLLVAGALGAFGSWKLQMLLAGVIGLVLLVLTPSVVGETPRVSGRFDITGALVSTLGLVSLAYGLSASALPYVVAGIVLLALFFVITRRASQPLLDLSLFKSNGGAYLTLALMPGAQIGLFFFLGQYLQLMSGWTPMTVALAFLLVSVGMIGAAGPAGKLESRLGGRTIVLGALMLIVANLLLLRVPSGGSFWTTILPSLFLVGAGLAFTIIPATIKATSGVEDSGSGSASSVVNAVQNVGSSISLAIIIAISTAAASGVAEESQFTASMSASFLAGAGFATAIALVALLIRSRRA